MVLLFALLAMLQGLAPLLHTHVTGTAAATAQGGVHLPVALAHAHHVGTAEEQACGAMDEPGVITAPPELRRDPVLAPDLPCALMPSLPVRSVIGTIGNAPPETSPRFAVPSVVLPPAQAPPLSA